MKTIVKVLILPLLCVLACGCKQEPDPFQEALGAYILQGQAGSFELFRIEKIDSTTFRTEFERREHVFQRKMEQETVLYGSYTMQRKPKNAARHWEAIQRTEQAIKGLDSLRAVMEGRLDEIAYYDYVFSGQSVIGEETTNYLNAFASMTPGLEVVALCSERRDLHKSGGHAIPGYLQMLRRTGEEEEE
ncbi:MAG: hypothetical protein IKP15_01205 [Bacteroidales bacterium]|nr:hypothetical protein [Bacteroidales bacterium]